MHPIPPTHLRIDHDGQQLGPLTLGEVRARLAAGSIAPTDLAWHTGALEWQPLAAIPGAIDTTPPPVPADVPPAAVPDTPRFWMSRVTPRRVDFVILAVVIVAVAALAGVINHKLKEGNRENAYGKVRCLGLAMLSFEQEYGTYPCDSSGEVVLKLNPDLKTNFGKGTANAYFRQLIAAGYIDTEMPFYLHIAGCQRPDNNMGGSHCLEKGECGYSYIIGCSSKANPPQPLMLTPLIPGTDRFDPKPFGGKAVVLWTDCSVTTPLIDRSGHVIHRGANLLDPANPVWQGKPPRIVWPE